MGFIEERIHRFNRPFQPNIGKGVLACPFFGHLLTISFLVLSSSQTGFAASASFLEGLWTCKKGEIELQWVGVPGHRSLKIKDNREPRGVSRTFHSAMVALKRDLILDELDGRWSINRGLAPSSQSIYFFPHKDLVKFAWLYPELNPGYETRPTVSMIYDRNNRYLVLHFSDQYNGPQTRVEFQTGECVQRPLTSESTPQPGIANKNFPKLAIANERGSGSAGVISLNGKSYVLTASHVLKGKVPRRFAVDGKKIATRPEEWRIIYDNPALDVVFLENSNATASISPTQWSPHQHSESAVWVAAADHFKGPLFTHTIRNGRIEATGVPGPGNSGSLMYDKNGRWVGLYQQFHFFGTSSIALSADKIVELFQSRPASQIEWDEKGRRIRRTKGHTYVETEAFEAPLVQSGGGTGDGDGGTGHAAGGGTGDGEGRNANSGGCVSSRMDTFPIWFANLAQVEYLMTQIFLPKLPVQNNLVVDGKRVPIPAELEDLSWAELTDELEKNPARLSKSWLANVPEWNAKGQTLRIWKFDKGHASFMGTTSANIRISSTGAQIEVPNIEQKKIYFQEDREHYAGMPKAISVHLDENQSRMTSTDANGSVELSHAGSGLTRSFNSNDLFMGHRISPKDHLLQIVIKKGNSIWLFEN